MPSHTGDHMSHPNRKTLRTNLRRDLARRVSIIQRCLKLVWDRIIKSYCFGRPSRYLQLPDPGSTATTTTPATTVMCSPTVVEGCDSDLETSSLEAHNLENGLELDAVDLKISLLGDSQIGKTSFLLKAKYVGDKKDQSPGDQMEGLNSMDKTFIVRGARISYSIWEVGGDEKFQDQVEVACKDSVAIFFMFDLTSRCTLNSVFKWYKQARKCNQSAIPILIGTKFDDFIQLPIDLQWTIASQARAYAKALNATLFFSSATYNINVNKVFKFITAKLFDLPWTVERNLTIGEPIIDF